MPLTNLIINGDFESQFANWGGTDNEIGSFLGGTPHWTEHTYLHNGNTSNTLAEMDGHSGQTTVLEQSFTVGGAFTTDITFDAALRSGASSGEGFTVEILDSSGSVVGTISTITPTVHALTGYSIPVSFPAAGTYTLRFTEIGVDQSIGALLDNVSILTCFTRGTQMELKSGLQKIETLRVGDMVRTLDHGFQPIRWIGSTRCMAKADMAPILIRKGALGNTRDLRVSPNHRMLISDWRSELLFDAKEVLVPAKNLVNDVTIHRVEGGVVEYFHMLFDQHEIVFAEGAASESFYPAQDVLDSVEQATKDEILILFPQLGLEGFKYGAPARACLQAQEAALLRC